MSSMVGFDMGGFGIGNAPGGNLEVGAGGLSNINIGDIKIPEVDLSGLKGSISAQMANDPGLKSIGQQASTQMGATNLGVNIDPAWAQYQKDLAAQLLAQAKGEGPSLAQMQLKKATDRTMAQSLGTIKAGLGSNPALAARTAGLAASQQLANQGAESGLLRLKEQLAAQEQLAALANTGAGQSIQQQAADAGVKIDAKQAETQYLDMLQKKELAKLSGDYGIWQQAEANKGRPSKPTTWEQIKGGLVTGGTAAILAALSDENTKKNIKDGSTQVQNLMDKLSVNSYQYKNPKAPGAGEGQKVSVMAQDLQKDPIGKQAVLNTPQGLMLDYSKLLPAMLAANADQHKRIKELEAAQESKKAQKPKSGYPGIAR